MVLTACSLLMTMEPFAVLFVLDAAATTAESSEFWSVFLE